MKLTQSNFDKLINIMNHRLTNINNDLKWIKWLGYYVCGTLTISLVGGLL